MDQAADWETVRQYKKSLRTELKNKRNQLSPEYCQEADERIRIALKNTDIYKSSRILFCYVSMEGETDTRRLISEALAEGKRVAVPRCQNHGIMEACEIKSLWDLEPGFFGILEPKKRCEQMDCDALELCVIPCLSCSKIGVRLGYGGGYYDRFLPKTRAMRIVLCREKMVCEHIPRESHDCFIDGLITEKQVNFY